MGPGVPAGRIGPGDAAGPGDGAAGPGRRGPPVRVGQVPGVEPLGEAGLLGIAVSPGSPRPQRVRLLHRGRRQPGHADDPGRRRAAPGAGDRRRHPQGRPPRRRRASPSAPTASSTSRPATRATAPRRRTCPSLGGKILRVTHGRPARARQPVPRLAGLEPRPPQRAGLRLGLGRAHVRQRVRPEHLGRAQPHRARARTTAGRRSRDGPAGPASPTRCGSGPPTTPHPAGSPWAATATSTWRRCAGRALWQVPVAGGRAGTPRAPRRHLRSAARRRRRRPDGRLWVITNNTGRGRPAADDDRHLLRLGRLGGLTGSRPDGPMADLRTAAAVPVQTPGAGQAPAAPG